MRGLTSKTIAYFVKNEWTLQELLKRDGHLIVQDNPFFSYSKFYRFEDTTFSVSDFFSFLKYKEIYLSPLYSALNEEK